MIKVLELLTGLPAAGKTTWANFFLANGRSSVVHIDVDNFRKRFTGKWFEDKEKESFIKEQVISIIYALFDSDNYHIILNDSAWFINNIDRQQWIKLCKDNDWKIMCTYITTDFAQCVINDQFRERRVSSLIMKEICDRTAMPSPHEGFYQCNFISWENIRNIKDKS